MSGKDDEKERVEKLVVDAARASGAPIPTGGTRGKPPAPDFWFNTDRTGVAIEVTELLCPAGTDRSTRKSGPLPVEREKFHGEVVRLAQRLYYAESGGETVRAHVVFANAREKRQDKKVMAQLLSDYVKAHRQWAGSAHDAERPPLPEGFTSISVFEDVGEWWSDECVSYAIDDIHKQLADRIAEKNKNVPTYRAQLPICAEIWLLIYTGVGVTRSVPVPHGIEQWKVPFDFDKVLWFVFEEERVIELQRLVPYSC
jgi:hypothetical protein